MTVNPIVAKIKQFNCSRRHRETDKQTNKQTTFQKPNNINHFSLMNITVITKVTIYIQVILIGQVLTKPMIISKIHNKNTIL